MARYEILSEIGRGMMGVVMRARDRTAGREVALKLISAEMVGEADVLARFRLEADALRALDHPAIVKVFDSGIHEGRPYLAMELLSGHDLYTIHRARAVPVEELLGWIKQAAEALAYMHARGVVHRDVKPSNIMVEASGRAVLTDFGLVRVVGTPGVTAPGSTVGTPRFMPPEALVGEERAGPPGDVYSLGITLFELLAGRSWCGPLEEQELLARIVCGPGPDLKQARPDVPSWVHTLVGLATHRDAAVRPTAAEMAERLATRWTSGQTVALGADPKPMMQTPGAPAAAGAGADGPPVTGQLRGRYRLIEKLGAGGMGVVYRAEQVDLKREVALKCILPQTDPGPQFLERFRREAVALSRVSHPGLVKVFDVSEEGAEPYIAMELVRGRTMETAVAADPMTIRRDSDRIFESILEAVAMLHDSGIIHRDLKPSNIMLTSDRQPVVMDLGLVKDFHGNWTGLTATGAVIGTPTYLAPEVLVHGEVRTSADVWALGTIYYFIQTGRALFGYPTIEQIFKAITSEPLPDLAAMCPDLDEQRRTFLARLLERDPARRPKDARRALELFRRVLAGGSITPISLQRAAVPGVRSSSPLALRAVAFALGAALTGAGLFAASSLIKRPEPIAPPPTERPPPASAAPVSDGPAHHEARDLFSRYWSIETQLTALRDPKTARATARKLHESHHLPLGGDPRSWVHWIELGRWLNDQRAPYRPASAPVQDPATTLVEQQLFFPRVWRAAHITPLVVVPVVWVIEMAPGEPTGWFALGYILDQEGRPDMALAAYRRALRYAEALEIPGGAPELVWKGVGRALARVPGRSLQDWERLATRESPSWRATEGLRIGYDRKDRAPLRSLFMEISKRTDRLDAAVSLANELEVHDLDPVGARAKLLEKDASNDSVMLLGQQSHYLRRGRIADARRIINVSWMKLLEAEKPEVMSSSDMRVGAGPGEMVRAVGITLALERRDLDAVQRIERDLEAGELSDVQLVAEKLRAGDRTPSTAVTTHGFADMESLPWRDLDLLAGTLAAPADAAWFAEAMRARIARPGAPVCPMVALALWHSRSRRHAAALDALEPVRTHPHVVAHHAADLLEVLARPLMDRLAGKPVDPAVLARLPAPDRPPAALHTTSAPLWKALAAGDAQVAIEAARAALDVLPTRALHVLALAHAAAAHPDPAVRTQGATEARVAARWNGTGLWVLDTLRELGAKR